MNIQTALDHVVRQVNLSQTEMSDVMRSIMSGDATPAQIGGLLVGLRMKGETIDEITAAARVMRELALPVPVSDLPHLIDIVGTGGDGQHLFNVSTASAFVAAAAVVTFVTFLPSFIFILAGGPLVEATHGKLGFTAPLSAITAAVVGVILNLALFFAYHLLWPQGFGGRFDAVSAVIAVGALVALFRLQLGVMPLLGGCAVVGLLVKVAAPHFA